MLLSIGIDLTDLPAASRQGGTQKGEQEWGLVGAKLRKRARRTDQAEAAGHVPTCQAHAQGHEG